MELSLAYREEANCSIGEELLVNFIHLNRISNELKVSYLLEKNSYLEEKIVDITAQRLEDIENMKEEMKKMQADMKPFMLTLTGVFYTIKLQFSD